MAIDRDEAQRIRTTLLDAPLAPGGYSHFINAGTDWVLDLLENEYFKQRLPSGAGCFKFLEGQYGSGKTQFTYSLAARAWKNNVATAIVNIDISCPFYSPLSIYKHLMVSFVAPDITNTRAMENLGIEFLIKRWIQGKLSEIGLQPGDRPEPEMRKHLDQLLSQNVMGSPDIQTTLAIRRLARTMLDEVVGGGAMDVPVLMWLRGDAIATPEMKKASIVEKANDQNAFARLKAVLAYLRKVLGYQGFFIAFDEGTRTGSFKGVKQKQAVENMLTMINEATTGGFASVMFMYAATPDFRMNVVNEYPALDARIGSTAFSNGSPMVPLINLDALISDNLIIGIGKRLQEVFSRASGYAWDDKIQEDNMRMLMAAEKDVEFTSIISPRRFVYHYCLLLLGQEREERSLSKTEAHAIAENQPPERPE